MTLPLYQVDAFSDTLFKGNPAAVCPLETWLPEEIMQRIALENNLAETAFFVKEDPHFHIRWFTPTMEVALCGHATIATAHILAKHLGFVDATISFTCLSGLISVRIERDLYVLNFPSDFVKEPENVPVELIQGVGETPQKVYQGKHDYLMVYANEEAIKRIQPEWNTLAKVKTRGIIITAQGKEYDFVSRFFAPAAGINEDPVTGSAHTSLIPYWAARLNKDILHAKQVSSRGGTLFCKNVGDRSEIGGKAVTYMEGTIFI